MRKFRSVLFQKPLNLMIVLVDGRANVDEPWMVRGEPTVNEYDHFNYSWRVAGLFWVFTHWFFNYRPYRQTNLKSFFKLHDDILPYQWLEEWVEQLQVKYNSN